MKEIAITCPKCQSDRNGKVLGNMNRCLSCGLEWPISQHLEGIESGIELGRKAERGEIRLRIENQIENLKNKKRNLYRVDTQRNYFGAKIEALNEVLSWIDSQD